MKNYNKKIFHLKIIELILWVCIAIFLLLGLCSCNTQKRIILTDQQITYKIDTVIKLTMEHAPLSESKPLPEIIYKYDTIKIETIRTKVKTFYDTVYKEIVTKVESKEFEIPIKIDKTIKTKTKEKIKEKKVNLWTKLTLIFWACFIACWFVYSFRNINKSR